jgi:hypothetical protein
MSMQEEMSRRVQKTKLPYDWSPAHDANADVGVVGRPRRGVGAKPAPTLYPLVLAGSTYIVTLKDDILSMPSGVSNTSGSRI